MTRSQIQVLIGHSDKRRISAWLLDLRQKQYLDWMYDPTDFYAKTRPAVYYLGINGTRYFFERSDDYPVEAVRKRYRECMRSQSYIDRCLMIADVSVTFEQAFRINYEIAYFCETEAEYTNQYYFAHVADSDLIHPHLCIEKLCNEGSNEPVVLDTFYFEVFDTNYPRYRMAKRLKDYIEYLNDNHWEDDNETDHAPIVLIVCPRMSDLIYAKRRTRGLYGRQNIQDKDTPSNERLHIRFTTVDKLKAYGILQADIWEEA